MTLSGKKLPHITVFLLLEEAICKQSVVGQFQMNTWVMLQVRGGKVNMLCPLFCSSESLASGNMSRTGPLHVSVGSESSETFVTPSTTMQWSECIDFCSVCNSMLGMVGCLSINSSFTGGDIGMRKCWLVSCVMGLTLSAVNDS